MKAGDRKEEEAGGSRSTSNYKGETGQHGKSVSMNRHGISVCGGSLSTPITLPTAMASTRRGQAGFDNAVVTLNFCIIIRTS